MNLTAFAKDLNSCARSPWVRSYRLRAFAAFAIERWNDYSPWKWQPDIESGITCGTRQSKLIIRMSSEDYAAYRELFLYGYYDHDLGQPETILDLGAYCGYTALAFSARFPSARIAAVEPHPANFASLKAHVSRNNLTVTAFQAAATVADGPVPLFLGGGMTHGLMPTAHSTGSEITVQGLSVPTLLERLGWERIDLLKIDIEGAEELLFGARQPWLGQVRTIIGEFHGAYRIPELRAHLEPLGFRVTELPHPNIFLAVRTE